MLNKWSSVSTLAFYYYFVFVTSESLTLDCIAGNVGYDAAIGEYVDLVKTGVIDPTKVKTLRS